MNPILQGLNLSLLGLGLTFAALGLFVVVMIVLERLFRARPTVDETHRQLSEPAASATSGDTQDEEVAAAIVAAMTHLRSVDICRSDLGAALEAGRGAWWNVGLSRATSQKIIGHG